MFNRLSLMAGAAALALGWSGIAQASALTQVGSLAGSSYLTFGDAPGFSFSSANYTLGSNVLSFSGGSNTFGRLGVGTDYTDSNFATGTQLAGQCAFAASCDNSSPLQIAFSTSITSFTVSVDSVDTTAPYTFAVAGYAADGSLLGLIEATSTANSGNSPAILAATSSAAIASIQITDFATPGASGRFVVGNIGVNGSVDSLTPVVEPASFAMFGVGLLGLTAAARRRRV